MEDLGISIIRGAYRFEQMTGKLKGDEKTFLSIKSVDVSIAWREVFGTFNVNTSQGISKAIENGFSEKLPAGLENKYHLGK